MFRVHDWFFSTKKQPQEKQHEFKCGHTGPLVQEVTIFGQKEKSSLKPDQFEWCHECLAKMAIMCAWCSEPILIGELIVFHSHSTSRVDKVFLDANHFVQHPQDPSQFVCCMRMGCAVDARCDGIWMPPGKVMRVLSPIEEAMGQVERGEPSSPIVVSDLCDPREAKILR